jgi:hypothetical protein
MPLMLTPAERAMLEGLAAPVDENRRPEFLSAVTTKLEATGPAAIGEGSLHRAARSVIANFWVAPPDLRQGRVGPRGPRNV